MNNKRPYITAFLLPLLASTLIAAAIISFVLSPKFIETPSALLAEIKKAETPEAQLEAARRFLFWIEQGMKQPITPVLTDEMIAILKNPAKYKEETRSFIATGLGYIDEPQTVHALMEVLNDPNVDVRWSAAVSLSRKGHTSGIGILMQMLDRTYLSNIQGLNEADIDKIMIKAAQALASIPSIENQLILKRVAQTDTSPKVQKAVQHLLTVPQLLSAENAAS